MAKPLTKLVRPQACCLSLAFDADRRDGPAQAVSLRLSTSRAQADEVCEDHAGDVQRGGHRAGGHVGGGGNRERCQGDRLPAEWLQVDHNRRAMHSQRGWAVCNGTQLVCEAERGRQCTQEICMLVSLGTSLLDCDVCAIQCEAEDDLGQSWTGFAAGEYAMEPGSGIHEWKVSTWVEDEGMGGLTQGWGLQPDEPEGGAGRRHRLVHTCVAAISAPCPAGALCLHKNLKYIRHNGGSWQKGPCFTALQSHNHNNYSCPQLPASPCCLPHSCTSSVQTVTKQHTRTRTYNTYI